MCSVRRRESPPLPRRRTGAPAAPVSSASASASSSLAASVTSTASAAASSAGPAATASAVLQHELGTSPVMPAGAARAANSSGSSSSGEQRRDSIGVPGPVQQESQAPPLPPPPQQPPLRPSPPPQGPRAVLVAGGSRHFLTPPVPISLSIRHAALGSEGASPVAQKVPLSAKKSVAPFIRSSPQPLLMGQSSTSRVKPLHRERKRSLSLGALDVAVSSDVAVCSLHDSFLTLMNTFFSHPVQWIRRVYIVDAQRRPIGVVTLTEALAALLRCK